VLRTHLYDVEQTISFQDTLFLHKPNSTVALRFAKRVSSVKCKRRKLVKDVVLECC